RPTLSLLRRRLLLLLRDLLPLLTRLGEPDRDRLLLALHLLARSARSELAALSLVHRPPDLLARGLAVFAFPALLFGCHDHELKGYPVRPSMRSLAVRSRVIVSDRGHALEITVRVGLDDGGPGKRLRLAHRARRS